MKLFALMLGMATLSGVSVAISPPAQACDVGNYYDPMHQICAPYPPTNCPPQYWQACAYPYSSLPPR